jgi:hypothetical protein
LKKKDADPKMDLSGPGLRSRSLGLPDLRPDLTCVFSGTPDLRPDLTWGFPDTLDLQVRSRSQVRASGDRGCGRFFQNLHVIFFLKKKKTGNGIYDKVCRQGVEDHRGHGTNGSRRRMAAKDARDRGILYYQDHNQSMFMIKTIINLSLYPLIIHHFV